MVLKKALEGNINVKDLVSEKDEFLTIPRL